MLHLTRLTSCWDRRRLLLHLLLLFSQFSLVVGVDLAFSLSSLPLALLPGIEIVSLPPFCLIIIALAFVSLTGCDQLTFRLIVQFL